MMAVWAGSLGWNSELGPFPPTLTAHGGALRPLPRDTDDQLPLTLNPTAPNIAATIKVRSYL